MLIRKLFPYAMAVCLVSCLQAATASAQNFDTRARHVSISNGPYGVNRLENEPTVDAEEINLEVGEAPHAPSIAPLGRALQLNQLLLAAIDDRIGAPYVYG